MYRTWCYTRPKHQDSRMRVFKTRGFQKWASREGLTDETLRAAVEELEDGLIDAELGGHVVKKRVALPGRGKRGGSCTLVVFPAIQ
jgi:hypothetical protein